MPDTMAGATPTITTNRRITATDTVPTLRPNTVATTVPHNTVLPGINHSRTMVTKVAMADIANATRSPNLFNRKP